MVIRYLLIGGKSVTADERCVSCGSKAEVKKDPYLDLSLAWCTPYVPGFADRWFCQECDALYYKLGSCAFVFVFAFGSIAFVVTGMVATTFDYFFFWAIVPYGFLAFFFGVLSQYVDKLKERKVRRMKYGWRR